MDYQIDVLKVTKADAFLQDFKNRIQCGGMFLGIKSLGG